MAFRSNTPCWEAPKFTFSTQNHADEWKAFYIRSANFHREQRYYKKGWKQFRMMFEGEDCQALQTLINNSTISPEDPHKSLSYHTNNNKRRALCHCHNEILLNLQQKSDEGIHFVNNWITTLINNAKFTHTETKETLYVMLLQHAICYHEAQDWICQQNQHVLTNQALLSHCKLLKSWCEQYYKAKEKGCTDLTLIKAASSTASSIHQDTLNTKQMHPVWICTHKKQLYRLW